MSTPFKCFFSELSDLTSSIKSTKSHANGTFNGTHNGTFNGMFNGTFNGTFNCTIQIKNETNLLIVTRGGSLFELPLDRKIEAVFPIVDGVIVEFVVINEPKLQEILNSTKSTKLFEKSQPLYSYALLTKHPLNPIKPLFFRKSVTDKKVVWYNLPERICFSSRKHPLLLLHNPLTLKLSIHLLKEEEGGRRREEEGGRRREEEGGRRREEEGGRKREEDGGRRREEEGGRRREEEGWRRREEDGLNFLNNNYFLSSLEDTDASSQTDLIYSEGVLEDLVGEGQIKKCKVLRAEEGVFMGVLVGGRVKIYGVKEDGGRVCGVVNDVVDIHACEIMEDGIEEYQPKKQASSSIPPSSFLPSTSFLSSSFLPSSSLPPSSLLPPSSSFSSFSSSLPSFLLLLHPNFSLSLLHGASPLLNYFFPTNISNTLKEEITEILGFQAEFLKFRMKDGSLVKIKAIPKIAGEMGKVVEVIRKVVGGREGEGILRDCIRNCLAVGEFRMQANDTWKTKSLEFDNFVLLLLFLLKLGQKLHKSDQSFQPENESPSKKTKLSSENLINRENSPFYKMISKQISKKEHSVILPNFVSPTALLQPSLLPPSSVILPNFVSPTALLQPSLLPPSFSLLPSSSLPPSSLPSSSFPPSSLSPSSYPHSPTLSLPPNSLLPSSLPPPPSSLLPSSSSCFLPLSYEINPAMNFELETAPEAFYEHRVRIFRALHLLYQEMKISANNQNMLEDLAFLMYNFAQNLDHSLSFIYSDYYIREYPSVILRSSTSSSLSNLDLLLSKKYSNFMKGRGGPPPQEISRNSYLELSPPNLALWQVKMLTRDDEVEKFPVLFRQTRFICKLIEKVVERKKTTYFPNELIASSSDISSSLPTNSLFYQNFLNNNFEKALKNKKRMQLFKRLKVKATTSNEKVFIFLMKEGVTTQVLDSLPSEVRLGVFEALRVLKRDFSSKFWEKLPKKGYELIDRSDVFFNLAGRKSKSKGLKAQVSEIIRGNKSFEEEVGLDDEGAEQRILAGGILKTNDLIFSEVHRLLDISSSFKIKPKYVESIPEDRLEVDSQNILMKLSIRRLSNFIGRGAFNYSSHQTFITEVLKIGKTCFIGVLPNEVKVGLDLKEEGGREGGEAKTNLTLWPDFHNGVSSALRISKEGIGMSGNHLRTWIFYQRPENPKYEHAGFLLGLGLLGYLSSFLPTDIYQYLKQSHDATTVGILLGLAASRIGKMEENISKTLCLHIPYLLPPNYDVEISLIVQTAALVGIGLLNKGSTNRLMTEMTLAQIGRKPLNDKCLDRDGYSLAAGYALGLINLGKGGGGSNVKDLDLEERLVRFVEGGKPMEPPSSMLSSTIAGENRCSSIREGKTVNTHITAPAALLALSLIYLKSNNEKLVKRITIPDSFSAIEGANPNQILLKVLARNLIMWDNIKNSKDFIYEQIPELIAFIYEKKMKEVAERYSFVYNVEEIDFNTVTLIYVNIIGGCILAMGLKYAGTGDQAAVQTILNELENLRRIKIAKSDLANDPANKSALDQYNNFSLLCVLLLSLSLVMAGTCDVQCLKVARVVRKRLQDAGMFHYGFNMAVNMAIGFLFLGNGNHSFKRDDLSLAGLLISVYPHFPNSTNDNKYHLQALRHFYVLAIEQRVFHAIDVDRNLAVNVNVELEFKMNDFIVKERHMTPLLLQDSKILIGVKIMDPDFYNSEIFVEEGKRMKVIYVKRRIQNDSNEESSTIDLLKSLNSVGEKYSENLSEVYSELSREDRTGFMELYLSFFKKHQNINDVTPKMIQSLIIAQKFYENTKLISNLTNNSISRYFNSTKLKLQLKKIESLLEGTGVQKSEEFYNYFGKPEIPMNLYNDSLNETKIGNLMKFCFFYQIPNKYEIILMKKFFSKLNLLKKNTETKDEGNDGITHLAKMVLFFQFTISNQKVLLNICNEIHNKKN